MTVKKTILGLFIALFFLIPTSFVLAQGRTKGQGEDASGNYAYRMGGRENAGRQPERMYDGRRGPANQTARNGQRNRKMEQNQSLVIVLENVEPADLSESEEDGILFMLEEEKLARDVYTALYEKWGIPVFENIASGEQTHMNDMLFLVERYDLENPITTDKAGVFNDSNLQKLYTELIAEGSQSLEAAFKVGATIEDLDIADLMEERSESDNKDIAIVYQNLEKGSRNHLRSFIYQLDRMGAEYAPRYISSDYFNSIIGSDRETATMITDPEYQF